MKRFLRGFVWEILYRLFRSYSCEGDPHKWLAAHVFGKLEAEVTKDERFIVKHAIFNAIKGRDPVSSRRALNMSIGFVHFYGSK